jgi:hypothetical protein
VLVFLFARVAHAPSPRYIGFPIVPRIYCDPTPAGTAEWNRRDIKGECLASCKGPPPGMVGVSWPYNCTNGLIEGATNKPHAPPSTCVGSCRDG